jgi:shikimate kinase
MDDPKDPDKRQGERDPDGRRAATRNRAMIRFGWKKRDRAEYLARVQEVRRLLGDRSIVMVGLMGCGKSSIGRRLATALDLPFVDADEEIERAALKTIPEIFADHGEVYFRDGERKVIKRLLGSGPQVLATGGGAYMNEETRAAIKAHGVSIWLRADLDVLMRRVAKRDNRPLLKADDPAAVMRNLMEQRYPVYAQADITVDSRDTAHEVIVAEIVNSLAARGDLADAAAAANGDTHDRR